MSIYATLWILRFPRFGDFHTGCEWVEVLGQGVPDHIGTPTPGYGYENGDPYGSFLPPPIPASSEDDEGLRAVVVVTRGTPKGTPRSGQEYSEPLLVMSGTAYRDSRFGDLVERIASSLRAGRAPVLLEIQGREGGRALAQTVRMTEDTLTVDLVDGRTLSVPLAWYPRLAHGTLAQRGNYELIGRGEGIHWPTLDEDISIEGLLAGRGSGETPASLRRWLLGRQAAG